MIQFELFLVMASVISSSAVQTDWSGGQDAGEPVSAWDDHFSSLEGVSALASPGLICLGSEPRSACLETIVEPSLPLAALDSGDINGDGLIDLAGASLVEGHCWWFENAGDDQWITHALPGEFGSGQGCSVFDVNADGHPDIIGCMCDPDCIVVWYNGQGTGEFGEPELVAESFPGAHCAVGCFADQDGVPDILAVGNQCHEVAVWFGLGNGEWEKKIIDDSFSGTQSVSPGDFDGDGLVDAVAASFGLAEFAWYRNPGNRIDQWEKNIVGSGMPGAHHVVAADMNLDGFMDVLGTSYSNKRITWWENDGAGQAVWEAHTIAPSLTGAVTAVPADLDGDNDIDVAGAGWIADRVNWYENTDGAGESWQVRTASVGFNGAWPLAVADFDGNGAIEIAAGADVLGGAGSSHGPSIISPCGFLESGWLQSSVLDTGEEPQWASFQFQAELPSGCGITFYWRSSQDAGDLGEWNGPYTDWSELSGFIHRFVQYRVELTGPGDSVSPILDDVELFWDPQGIQGSAGVPLFFAGSPCSRSSGVRVVLGSCSGQVDLSLMDLSGRVIARASGNRPGDTLNLGRVCPGVYLIRAESLQEDQTAKLCVLN